MLHIHLTVPLKTACSLSTVANQHIKHKAEEKWVVTLVNADRHYNLPTEICMGIYTVADCVSRSSQSRMPSSCETR